MLIQKHLLISKLMNNSLKFISIEIAARIKELFKSLSKDYIKLVYEEEDEICSFGIFTDSDISVFTFAYNTLHGIKSKMENRQNDEYNLLYKWWIPDWSTKIRENIFDDDLRETELFNILEKLIEETGVEDEYLEDEYFSNYKNDIFDLFCLSLEELNNEKVFIKRNNDFILLVQESDNGIKGDLAREASLLRLLTKDQIEDYKSIEKKW